MLSVIRLGQFFILHLVDKYNLKLKLAIFVSPFFNFLNKENIWQFDHVNSSFYKTGFDFKKIKKLILNSYVIPDFLKCHIFSIN